MTPSWKLPIKWIKWSTIVLMTACSSVKHCLMAMVMNLYSAFSWAVFNWVPKVISELLWFCITSFEVLAPFFRPISNETKTSRGLRVHIFPRFVSATCNHFDWFTVLSPSSLIDQCDYFGFGFTTFNWNSLYLRTQMRFTSNGSGKRLRHFAQTTILFCWTMSWLLGYANGFNTSSAYDSTILNQRPGVQFQAGAAIVTMDIDWLLWIRT